MTRSKFGADTKNGKYFLVVLAIMALLLTVSAAMMPGHVNADANDIVSKNIGSYSGYRASIFIYKGQYKCFCLEAHNGDPSGTDPLGEEIYNNSNIAKALYYGQYGAEPWDGFGGDEAKGVVITSLTLSDLYGNAKNYDTVPGVKEFKAFLESKPMPPSEITRFTKKSLKTTWDAKRKVQVTEDNEIKGSEGQKLSFNLPKGVKAVKKDGNVLTGKVTLSAGEIFHLEAEPGVTGIYNTGEIGKNFKYQPIVVKTVRNKQDIGTLKIVEDKTAVTQFQATWLRFNEVRISKQDITNKKELPGAKMRVIDAESGILVDEWTSTDTPHIISNLVNGRKYILSELVAPKGFRISREQIEFVAGQKDHVVMFNTPEKKPKSPKTGDDNSLSVPITVLTASVASVLAAVYMRRRVQK